MLLLNVYMPYYCSDNYDTFICYLQMVNSIVSDFASPFCFIVGDFNANILNKHGDQLTHRFGK